jgi:50S ribosomal protein L16 3-hydroxylase
MTLLPAPQTAVINGWSKVSQDIFISQFLQKKPLLVRNAFTDIESLVDMNFADFCELAADDDVESRIYSCKRGKHTKDYGPFESDHITKMQPDDQWSLLIQEMDRHIPKVADLWTKGFSFMPNWRRDDIMFSYSVPGGSIGAHVDNYDVFLLQGRYVTGFKCSHSTHPFLT